MPKKPQQTREEILDLIAEKRNELKRLVEAFMLADAPKAEGDRVDQYYTLRSSRIAIDQIVKALQGIETAESSTLGELMKIKKLLAFSGSIATFSRSPKDEIVPEIVDWEAAMNHVIEHRIWTLPQRRVTKEVFLDYLDENGVSTIAGIESKAKVKYNLTKRGS